MTDQPRNETGYGSGGGDPQGTGATDRNTAGAVFDDRFKEAVKQEQNRDDGNLAQEASRDTSPASAGLAGGGYDQDVASTAGGLGGTQAGAGAPDTIGSGDPFAADRQGDIAADDAGASAAVGDQIAVQGEDPVR